MAADAADRTDPVASALELPKLVFRHALCRLGLLDAYTALRLPQEQVVRRRPNQSLSDIFSQIYARGLWVEGQDQDSRSGSGSTNRATQDLVGQLSGFLAEVCCGHLVDIGCGDFNWMRRVEGRFHYTGIDVVPEVIAQDARRYGDARRRFLCCDATREPIPAGDVALCREVLFHLSFRDGLGLLANVKRAGFRYVVLTHDAGTLFNGDITSGGFRPLNLTKAPYRLPAPARMLVDDNLGLSQERVLGIWDASALPD